MSGFWRRILAVPLVAKLIGANVIIVASAHEWLSVLSGRKRAISTEVGYRSTRDFAMQATGGA